MSRIFDNNLNLSRFVLLYRALDADPNIEIRLYDARDPQTLEVNHHYVEVESTLTDAQITNALATPQTQAEANAYTQYVGARVAAKAIPNWATWTEAEALNWGANNIGTPLANARANLPATLTLATTRAAFVTMLNILDAMYLFIAAAIRMIVALRNKVF